MPAQFFKATRDYRTRHTEVFDFVTPLAAAMWNLRWQVQGFVSAVPDASLADLQGRFLAGSGIRSANVRRAAIDQTWEQQTEQLARFSLYVFVALYEAWLDEIVQPFARAGTIKEQLQFPSRGTYGFTRPGVRDALADLTRVKSRTMTRNFGAALRAQPQYGFANLDSLLACYRYFKECRNALLHAGGRASHRLATASRNMGQLSASDLGTRVLRSTRCSRSMTKST